MVKLNKNLCIAVFAYNRPSHLRRVLIALENYKINSVNLFVDGPKNQKDRIIQKDFKQIFKDNKFNKKMKKTLHVSNKNIGLAKSIERGISQLSKKYEYILILEDDCIPRPEVFKFISKNLSNLKKDGIGGICCYQLPEIHRIYENNNELNNFILKYFIPWGWCLASKNWRQFKKNKLIMSKKKIEDKILKKIDHIVKDKKKIWSLNFMKYNQLTNKNFIFPSKSLIKNIGFDGSGVNSKITNKFNTDYSPSKKISSKLIFDDKLILLQKKILLKRIKFFY